MDYKTINVASKEPIVGKLGSVSPSKSGFQTRYKELQQLIKPGSVSLTYPFEPLTEEQRLEALHELRRLQGDEL